MGVLLVVMFIVFVAIGVPISFALGVVSFTGIASLGQIPNLVVFQKMFNGLNSFTLLAVPLFILAANLMNEGEITEKLIDCCNSLVGHLRGGLAYSNVLVSMIFAGISGSSQADTAGIGSILIPAMEEEGYSQETSVGVTAASSTIGIVIPPSIPMVVYSSVAGASIGALFLGGVVPGILIGLMWRWMYDGNYGVLNDILQKLHILNKSIPFLAQTNTAFPAVVVTIIWQGIPFFALMILAGLQGIPGELYEAADMDGATGFQKLFKITIPSIKNTIFITGLLRIIWVANSVDVIFNMTEGGPAYATQTLSVYVFNKAQALNLGYSSAMAILLALVLCLVAVPYLIFTFREEDK